MPKSAATDTRCPRCYNQKLRSKKASITGFCYTISATTDKEESNPRVQLHRISSLISRRVFQQLRHPTYLFYFVDNVLSHYETVLQIASRESRFALFQLDLNLCRTVDCKNTTRLGFDFCSRKKKPAIVIYLYKSLCFL